MIELTRVPKLETCKRLGLVWPEGNRPLEYWIESLAGDFTPYVGNQRDNALHSGDEEVKCYPAPNLDEMFEEVRRRGWRGSVFVSGDRNDSPAAAEITGDGLEDGQCAESAGNPAQALALALIPALENVAQRR
jgi:hypothetical protein